MRVRFTMGPQAAPNPRPLRGRWLLFGALPIAACATLAGGEGGDTDLPNAGIGPFRVIKTEELGNSRTAPNAMDDSRHHLRDVALLDVDGDPKTPEAWGYFAANAADLSGAPSSAAPPDEIVRNGALDGRSFDRKPLVALAPSAAWEGGTVGAPSVLRVGGEVFLYYAAKGGIGLARSPDGAKFTGSAQPVLAPEPGSWELGATPASPAVALAPDGSFRMFYEIAVGGPGATSLGEARSTDGVTWSRVGTAPALAPSPPSDADAADAPYDDLAVGSPFAIAGTTSEGSAVLRVYYAARDIAGHDVIGLAARFGSDGPLVRAVTPVFGTGGVLEPREPWVLQGDGYSLLFVTEKSGKTPATAYAAVAVGVAPALFTLPAPNPP